MDVVKSTFFSGLCFFVLLLARSDFKNKVAINEIYNAINESHSIAPSISVKHGKSITTAINEINGTVPTSNSNFGSHSIPSCSREEVREGSWQPVVLDAPPYFPRTVHLQCYPEREYKVGQWMHTYKWLPRASSSGACTFSDWNRDDFCRLTRRATILVRIKQFFSLFSSCRSFLSH